VEPTRTGAQVRFHGPVVRCGDQPSAFGAWRLGSSHPPAAFPWLRQNERFRCPKVFSRNKCHVPPSRSGNKGCSGQIDPFGRGGSSHRPSTKTIILLKPLIAPFRSQAYSTGGEGARGGRETPEQGYPATPRGVAGLILRNQLSRAGRTQPHPRPAPPSQPQRPEPACDLSGDARSISTRQSSPGGSARNCDGAPRPRVSLDRALEEP